MKKTLGLIAILFTTALLFMACSDDNQNGNTDSSSENVSASQSERDNKNEMDKKEDNPEHASESEETETNDSNKSPSQEESENTDESESEENKALSAYSAEEIEYARVWLQIVGNKDTEELNVQHISSGEQVNPYDEDSVSYPEDIIALGGKIMADGVVTYSGNGDGTINLYDVPSHWPSHEQIDESMEEYTEDIIENTEQIYIEPRDDEEIIELIKKINIQS